MLHIFLCEDERKKGPGRGQVEYCQMPVCETLNHHSCEIIQSVVASRFCLLGIYDVAKNMPSACAFNVVFLYDI